jgi:Co/Zn/Cd efflux system component
MNPDTYTKVSNSPIQISPRKHLITKSEKALSSKGKYAQNSMVSTNNTVVSRNQNHGSLFEIPSEGVASKFNCKKKCQVFTTVLISVFSIATLGYGGFLYNHIFAYLMGVNLGINLLGYLFTVFTLKSFELESKSNKSFGSFRVEVLLSLLYDIIKLTMACAFGFLVIQELTHVIKGNEHTSVVYEGSMIYALGIFGFMANLLVGYMLLMMEDVHIGQYKIQVTLKPDFEERVYDVRSTAVKSKRPAQEEISENKLSLIDVPNLRRVSPGNPNKNQIKGKKSLRVKIGLVRYLCTMAMSSLFLADSVLLLLLQEHNLFNPILTISSLVFIFVEISANFAASIPVLMESVPSGLDIEGLLEELKGIYSVESIHDFHTWSLTYEKVYLTAHVDIKDLGLEVRSVVIDAIKDLLREYGVSYCTLQIETEKNRDEYSSMYISCCNNIHQNLE